MVNASLEGFRQCIMFFKMYFYNAKCFFKRIFITQNVPLDEKNYNAIGVSS